MRIRNAVILVVLLVATPAAAQIPPPVVQPSPGIDFLTRFDFWMSASALAVDDPKFSWDTHFGGSADVFDYGFGRLGARIDYEAVLGDDDRKAEILRRQRGWVRANSWATQAARLSNSILGCFEEARGIAQFGWPCGDPQPPGGLSQQGQLGAEHRRRAPADRARPEVDELAQRSRVERARLHLVK